jgi:nucleoside-diphosphate-sugar epimerase
MKYVITGGCGFIGSNLIRRILREEPESEIFVFDDMRSGDMHYTKYQKYTYINTDVSTDMCGYINMSLKFDVMIHLAASSGIPQSISHPINDMSNNILTTLNCLELCKRCGIKRFIYASSGAVLGNSDTMPLKEDIIPKPVSPYGISKLASEGYCRAYSTCHNIDTICLRFSNVYGPYSMHKESFVHKYIKALFSRDEEFTIYGDGSQTRDFIHVSDITEAILRCCKSEKQYNGEIFNVSTGKPTKIVDVAVMINDIIANRLNFKIVTKIKHLDRRDGDVMCNYSDCSKIFNYLGYSPQIDLYRGLYDTIKWFEMEML